MEISYEELDENASKRIQALFPRGSCLVEFQPGHVVMPRKYMDLGESILEMEIFADDVWLVSYPRTGSTWAQEMVWLLGNRLDYEGAKKMLALRSPMIELTALLSDYHDEWIANSLGNTVDIVKSTPRPRFARSHLPWHLLPKNIDTVKPKIVYTARNPKDLCVSYYYYCKLMHGVNGSFEDFAELFLQERTPIGPYWQHVLPFWKRSNDPNVLFLKYEDMKRDLPCAVRKCAKFLQVDYKIGDKDMERICEHLKFDQMQDNPAVNLEPLLKTDENGNGTDENGDSKKFIRKGQIGDWKNYLSPELSRRFDEWIEANCRGSGLLFDYE